MMLDRISVITHTFDRMQFLLWMLLLIYHRILPGNALDISKCRLALGMQSMEIPDEAITASSSYNPESVGAPNARIRSELNGGAWCPMSVITRDVYEYLQIDLQKLKVITLVETQGRFGNGQGQEYADQYLMEYQRETGGNWFRFRNRRGQEIFQGNTNTYIAELREIDPPIIARRVRFIPYSEQPKSVCMRVELYGCAWLDGTISYSMPQGERRGTEIDLMDFTYDGRIEMGFLSGGLGQLTDGDLGQDNFRLDERGMGFKGYEWIGWRNDTHHPKHLDITFKFDSVRNFSKVAFHVNNYFNKDVRVFKTVRLWFSIGGENYLEQPLLYRYDRDVLMEFARTVSINLENRIGRFVKMQLEFDARWLMISEVQFISEPASGNFTLEDVEPTDSPTEPIASTDPTLDQPIIIDVVESENNKGDGANRTIYDTIPADRPTPHGSSSVLDVNHERNDDKDRVPSNDSPVEHNNVDKTKKPHQKSETKSTYDDDITESDQTKKSVNDQKIGIITGLLCSLILLLFVVIILIIWRQRRKKLSNGHRVMKLLKPHGTTMDQSDLQNDSLMSNGKLTNGNMYNCTSNSDNEMCNGEKVNLYGTLPEAGIQGRTLPYLSNIRPAYTSISPGHYAMPDIPIQPTAPPIYATYGRLPQSAVPPPVPPPPSHYAASDVISIQGVSGNNVYAAPNPDLTWTDDLSVMELPRGNLHFLEKLGEGQFGEVHLAEANNITDFLGDDFLINRGGGSPSLLVAVKMLRKEADHPARADFQKEMKMMARLQDANVVRVLGVCSQEEPFCVVVEYMKFGDLHQFMQLHTLEAIIGTKKRRKSSLREISYGCLIFIATQIASGMKYLESLNMVHRDLASRNCLVGSHFTIKVSDFGMSRSLYSGDYYRIEGRAVLPIRWMAWESIMLGRFSSKSDVWSFGVTLWEILSFCREQPYDILTDEQVIENCGHYYRNDGMQMYLPQPANCPREIYDLMQECWNRDEINRPAFSEIHMFLQRKNMGYDPKTERAYPPLV